MIKKNLELLGIRLKSQIEENDIHFWWQKKYTEILKSDLDNKNELLISLNSALEDLEKIDISLIKKELKTENKGKQTTQSENNNKQNTKDEFFYTSEEWKSKGDKQVNDLNYRKAIFSYTKALEIKKNYFDALLNRGICHLNLQNYNSALLDFNNAIKLDPKNYESYLLRGKTNFQLINFKNAVADFDKYIRFEKKNAEAYFMRGNAKVQGYIIGSKTYLSAYEDFLDGYKLDSDYEDRFTRENFKEVKEIIESSSKTNQKSPQIKIDNEINLDNDKTQNIEKTSNNLVAVNKIQAKTNSTHESETINFQSNKIFLNSKLSINNFFVIFAVIIALVMGNEIAKNNSFIDANNKVKNKNQLIKKSKRDSYIDRQVDNYVKRMKSKNGPINHLKNKRGGLNLKSGTKSFSEGTYIGSFLGNQRHGRGTMIWSDGDQYVGDWRYDQKSGEGTYFYSYDEKYEGEWRHDKKSGEGTYFYSYGDKYVGQWINNKMHGKGTYYYSNGDKYVGDWRHDQKFGEGTFTSSNGDRYVGGFRDNKIHGKGTYFYKNGEKYIGDFENGKRDGRGKMFRKNGELDGDGEWRDDWLLYYY